MVFKLSFKDDIRIANTVSVSPWYSLKLIAWEMNNSRESLMPYVINLNEVKRDT